MGVRGHDTGQSPRPWRGARLPVMDASGLPLTSLAKTTIHTPPPSSLFVLFFPIAWAVHAPGNPFLSAAPAGFFCICWEAGGARSNGFSGRELFVVLQGEMRPSSTEAPIKTVKPPADSCLPRVRQRGPCLQVGLKKEGGWGWGGWRRKEKRSKLPCHFYVSVAPARKWSQ